jgi:hypothetical protein
MHFRFLSVFRLARLRVPIFHRRKTPIANFSVPLKRRANDKFIQSINISPKIHYISGAILLPEMLSCASKGGCP